jgi:hypothetical protein
VRRPSGGAGADRLRTSGLVTAPAQRPQVSGVGVCDGAGLLPACCSCARCCGWTSARGGGAGPVGADNLKTGVDKPDLYDPKINRSYAELAAHYPDCQASPGTKKSRIRWDQTVGGETKIGEGRED